MQPPWHSGAKQKKQGFYSAFGRHALLCFVLAFLLMNLFLPAIGFAQQGVRPQLELRTGHPRLMFLDSDFAAIRRLIASDPQAARWHENMVRKAQGMITQPPAEHKLIGPRLLAQSRLAFDRISLLSALYRIDGNKEFAERARKEMLAVCAFPDWHPPHFLDVAEMTTACSIGYDWLYDYLSPADRQTISSAIIRFGLHPALDVLQSHTGWSLLTNNWSQVCNGGMSIGALAIADDDPDLANQVLALCRADVARPMHEFLAPDGGCIEGPGYWGYATLYTAYYLSALQTSLNTDFGFDASPGLADAGMFHIQSIGPLGKFFNFADSTEKADGAPQLFFFANRLHRPVYAQFERNFVGDHGTLFDLLWAAQFSEGETMTGPNGDKNSVARAASRPVEPSDLPLDAYFRGINTVFFRSAWNDPQAIYVGFKGGNNSGSHAHLDLGTFVLDALGERWAMQLGTDDYNLPGYFDNKNQRWTYYRLGTAGQNTLVINNANQAVAATAPIIAFKSTPEEAHAVADLTNGYPQGAQIRRGIGIFDRQRVLLIDEITLNQPADIVWQMHTKAQIKLLDHRAVLTLGGKTLYAHLFSPPNSKFEIGDVNPPRPNAANPGVRRLVVRVRGRGPLRISVLFDIANPEKPFYPQDLQGWIDDSKDN